MSTMETIEKQDTNADFELYDVLEDSKNTYVYVDDYISKNEMEKRVLNVMRRMPVMTLRQFLDTVCLLFDIREYKGIGIIKQLVRTGNILLSDTGYVTTKQAVDIVADSYDDLKAVGETRLTRLRLKPLFRDLIDCYYLVLDMYPESENFLVCDRPFLISFVDEVNGRLFEIMRYSETSGRAYMAQLSGIGYYRGEAAVSRRIIIIDDESQKRTIPYYGFSHICVLDNSECNGLRIVEKRPPETAWKDLRENY